MINHCSFICLFLVSFYRNCIRQSDLFIMCRWKGSGSSVNDATHDYQESRNNKEAAWEEINTLKQKIKEFSSKSPHTSSPSRAALVRSAPTDRYSGIINGSRTSPVYGISYFIDVFSGTGLFWFVHKKDQQVHRNGR